MSTATTVTADEIEQAREYEREQAFIARVHPDLEDRLLHRFGECDGSCERITEADLELAEEAAADHAHMVRCHPELEDQMLHRVGGCDGSCGYRH